MELVFFSSVLNHHQIPLCNELYKLLGDRFRFIATMELEEERKKLGYVQNDDFPYLLKMHTSKQNFDLAYRISQSADVMIAGVFPQAFLHERMKNNRVTFRYSERFFKTGRMRLFSPRALYLAYQDHIRYRNKSLYLLCASGYAASDAKAIWAYPGKAYKWGYFPEARKYEVNELMKNKKAGCLQLLWVGRFIEWKHPEHAVEVARRLAAHNVQFSMKMIGNGPLLGVMKKQAREFGLDSKVIFTDGLPPSEVRREMEIAHIYLFTSDQNEGWGAVLNESMNSGCAVVASEGIGAVPYLLKHSENGLVYKNRDVECLYRKVNILNTHRAIISELGINAYRTIDEVWNASMASKRLLDIAEKLMMGKQEFYDAGPMSVA